MRACISQCKDAEGYVRADRGFVCQSCYESVQNALPKVPALLMHLREVYTMQSKPDEGIRRTKKDPPAPFNIFAWDLSEQMFYALTESQIRVGYDADQLREIVHSEVTRIMRHLPAVANSRHIQSLLALPRLTKQAEKAFPMQEQRRTTALPCPNCNKRTIYTPPQAQGDNLEVVCFDCGFRIPPEKVEFYARLAEKESANSETA
jgi:predicted RNA-binding Zn-ribbon protein involved in translation (DUF1610 family)